MANNNGPKTTLYHSAAVAASPIQCRVTSEPAISKYPNRETGIKPYWVELIIDGVKRQYICENENCVKALRGLKNQNVTLTFEGSRDDATISVGGGQQRQEPADDPGDAPPDFNEPQQRRQRSDPPRKPADPVADEANDIKKAKATLMRLANMMAINLEAAEFLVGQHTKNHPNCRPFTSDNICSIAATLQIGAEKNGVHNLMPETRMELAPKGGAK